MTNNQMKKSNLILLIAFGLLVLLSISYQVSVHRHIVKGNEKAKESFAIQERSLPSFSQLEVSGCIKVLLTQEQKATLKIKAPENALDSITTHVRNNKLLIAKNVRIYGKDTVTIEISNPNLKELSLKEGAFLKGMNIISGDSLVVTVQGKSILNLQLAYQVVQCKKDKVSMVQLQGATTKINFSTTE